MAEVYVLEVIPSERSGRGRYWRPNSSGYTDDPMQAGFYPKEEAIRMARSGHSSEAIPADEVISEAKRLYDETQERFEDMIERSTALRNEGWRIVSMKGRMVFRRKAWSMTVGRKDGWVTLHHQGSDRVISETYNESLSTMSDEDIIQWALRWEASLPHRVDSTP